MCQEHVVTCRISAIESKTAKHSGSQCDKGRKRCVRRRHAGCHSCSGVWRLHRSASAEKSIHWSWNEKKNKSVLAACCRSAEQKEEKAWRRGWFRFWKETFSDRRSSLSTKFAMLQKWKCKKSLWSPRIRSRSGRLGMRYCYRTWTPTGAQNTVK